VTTEELEAELYNLLGNNFSIERDNYGQLVIYTGVMESYDFIHPGPVLVKFEPKAED